MESPSRPSPRLNRLTLPSCRTAASFPQPRWAVVPGAVVTRVLQICDPQGSLRITRTVEAAAATFADLPVRPPSPPQAERLR